MDESAFAPSDGLCHCGCGRPAPLAMWTNRRKGHVKGQPVRFLKGHHCRVGVKKPNDPVPLPFLGGPEYADWAAGFWSLVAKAGPDDCWPWIGRRKTGRYDYGLYPFGGCPDRLAHRLAYAITTGPVPAGAQVNHSCDNPPCCNPAHLHLGTHRSNMAEMAIRDRAGNLRFTAPRVDEIRRLREIGVSYPEIAARFDTCETTAQAIASGRRRRHLPSSVRPPVAIRQPIEERINTTLASTLVRSGCALHAVARGFGLHTSSIRYALSKAKGRGVTTIQPTHGAADAIAALIGQGGALVSPLGWSSSTGFIPMLPMYQETGLAAGHPLRSLIDLFRRLSHRLTSDETAELRTRFLLDGEPAADLADQFGITRGQVWRLTIPRGRGRSLRGEQNGNAKLTKADVHEIRRLHSEDGLGHRRIARRLGVSRAAVHRILTGRAWAYVEAV